MTFDEKNAGTLVSALVAGRRLRALGGMAEFVCYSGAPTGLAIFLPRQTVAAAEPSTRPSAVAKPLQVLVAEACDESFALSELLLQNESVDRARTGLEVIDKVKLHRFDIVIMDISHAWLGRLREHPRDLRLGDAIRQRANRHRRHVVR